MTFKWAWLILPLAAYKLSSLEQSSCLCHMQMAFDSKRPSTVHFKAEESATQSDLVQWEVIFLLVGANKVQHQVWVGFTLTTQLWQAAGIYLHTYC